ncbi:MAG TPA: S53 family peptidase [Tepidisphaeraceae bacterium]|nr:S53 family peptidase [Tepidisphaeraceae bacterium]
MIRRSRRENEQTETPALPMSLESLECRALLSTASDIIVHPNLKVSPQAVSSTVDGYTPAEIKSAYGFDLINFGSIKGDGAGQTIAIVDAYNNPNIASDLHVFDTQFGLADPPSFKQVSQTGGSTNSIATEAGWAYEIALDVEWAHAIAPKANILLVEAKNSSLNNLLAAVDYARKADGVSVVSLSWGTTEFMSQTSYDSYFTTPAGHQNVTFVAASGDDGAAWGPEWPASSTNVLSVGGTTLNIDSSGDYSSESAWRYSTGGTSRYETRPTYQNGVSTTAGRSSPDVSYNADPNTGFAVYDSLAYYDGTAGWSVVGGTSAGAPQWAALVAIADQGRAIGGMGTLSSTGTLTTLYGLYSNSATYAADFNDVATGSSTSGGFGFRRRFGAPAGSSAIAGYDRITGLGSPKAQQVVAALIGTSATAVASAKTTATKATARVKAAAVKETSDTLITPATATTIAARASASAMKAIGSAAALEFEQAMGVGVSQAATIAANLGSQSAAQVSDGGTLLGRIRTFSGFADAPALEYTSAAATVAAIAPTQEMASIANALTSTHIAHIVPMGSPLKLLADGVAAFADESASVFGASTTSQPRRAWTITASVIAADVLLFTYVYHRHSRKQKKLQAVRASV